jgi:hypothetical protein
MDQRIRDFEPLWNARVIPLDLLPLARPALVRSTCEHWTLPEAELARWFASPMERDAILAANRTVCRYSWNEPVEIDAEEARLNKELHFGYETYDPLPYYDPAAPDQEFDDLDDQEIGQPRAEWLQRVVGQDLTEQDFEQPRADWFQRTTGQDLRDDSDQDPAQDPDGFPAPLTAPLILDQDDIAKYFKPWSFLD